MATDSLFGGTPLTSAHFDSDIAKAVFNDKGRPEMGGNAQTAIENRMMDWLPNASMKSILIWAPQIDLLVVPILSPRGFRNLCSFLCENLPQAIEKMPNTRESVMALSRAVHLCKCINPSALDRIYEALRDEGLIKAPI